MFVFVAYNLIIFYNRMIRQGWKLYVSTDDISIKEHLTLFRGPGPFRGGIDEDKRRQV